MNSRPESPARLNWFDRFCIRLARIPRQRFGVLGVFPRIF